MGRDSLERRIALIDADVVAYKAAFSSEEDIAWGGGFRTLHSQDEVLKGRFEDLISELVESTGGKGVELAWSAPVCWRKAFCASYKAGRKSIRKPLGLSFVIEWAQEKYPSHVFPGLEGDDVIGILATAHPDKYLICSPDKDLKGVPGYHFNSDTKQVVLIGKEEADRWHMLQTLVGDAVDGYPGCPTVGPKTAEKLFAEVSVGPSMWDVVVKAFTKQGLTEEDALLQARLARILRCDDYDLDTGEITLWEPTPAQGFSN